MQDLFVHTRLYGRFLRLHLLSGLEYKGWWFMVLQVLFVCITDPLSTVLMFARFGGIGAWHLEHILLIYALALTAFGIAESLCRGLDYFPDHMLREGGFDRLLLRPKNVLLQVAASVFHIHRLARPISGFALILWCLSRLGVPCTLYSATIVITALFGGTLTYMGVFVLTSGIAFFTIKATDWIYIFTNASYQFTRIPMDYMPPLLKNLFSFLFPMLVISYYPAAQLCHWGEITWQGWLALPAGATFLGIAVLTWNFGLRHYKSTGS